jgi:peptidoglycan hydrolase CwlO-like protein
MASTTGHLPRSFSSKVVSMSHFSQVIGLLHNQGEQVGRRVDMVTLGCVAAMAGGVIYLDQKIEKGDNKVKEDVNEVKKDVNELKMDVNELKKDVNDLKKELKQDVDELKKDVKDDIKELKVLIVARNKNWFSK